MQPLCCCSFELVDGRLLAEVISLKAVCPDVFYLLMRDDLGLKMIDILNINAAMRELD